LREKRGIDAAYFFRQKIDIFGTLLITHLTGESKGLRCDQIQPPGRGDIQCRHLVRYEQTRERGKIRNGERTRRYVAPPDNRTRLEKGVHRSSKRSRHNRIVQRIAKRKRKLRPLLLHGRGVAI